VVVSLRRRDEPPVSADPVRIDRVVRAGFEQRRKTMRNALVRLGFTGEDASALLREARVDPGARAEELSIEDFARIAEALDG
jgi:16S rRNA (adenine1518-N6/adenine1519-N6)-dimethyltransferase